MGVKMINYHVVLPLSSMQTGQVLPVQVTNVITYPALGKQFMSNHRRNSTFLDLCGKQPVFLATKTSLQKHSVEQTLLL